MSNEIVSPIPTNWLMLHRDFYYSCVEQCNSLGSRTCKVYLSPCVVKVTTFQGHDVAIPERLGKLQKIPEVI